MKKKPQKKRKNRIADVLIIVILMILLVDALMIWMIHNSKPVPEEGTEQTQQEPIRLQEDTDFQPTIQQTVPDETSGLSLNAIEFPITLEDGNLTVLSMFQYSGLNPDCGDEDGTDIASLIVENTASSHLTSAQLEIMTDDGTLLHFTVLDLPAGRSAMVFCRDNTSIKVNTACVEINCVAEFEGETPLMPGLLEFTVSETGITVSNVSGAALFDVTIHCHGVLETEYYGGATYQYSISELAAGEKYEIDTSNEFFGMMEIVRVEALSE